MAEEAGRRRSGCGLRRPEGRETLARRCHRAASRLGGAEGHQVRSGSDEEVGGEVPPLREGTGLAETERTRWIAISGCPSPDRRVVAEADPRRIATAALHPWTQVLAEDTAGRSGDRDGRDAGRSGGVLHSKATSTLPEAARTG